MAEETVDLYFDLSEDGKFNPELIPCEIEEYEDGEIVLRSPDHGVFIKLPPVPKGEAFGKYLSRMVKIHNEANGPR